MTQAPTTFGEPMPLRRNPLLSRVLARVPTHIHATFTPEQIEALDAASQEIGASHLVAYRAALPGWRKRYYLAVFVGLDRRRKLTSFERLLRSGMRQTATRRLILSTLALLLVLLLLFSLFCGLYVLKSLAGIDVFKGHSFLHDILYVPNIVR